ncbi:MAG: hypothetical protein OES13_00285 [Acidimicrobiia bacterium]|nr:hypothetical protein [Acidimicrobiia bacterium]
MSNFLQTLSIRFHGHGRRTEPIAGVKKTPILLNLDLITAACPDASEDRSQVWFANEDEPYVIEIAFDKLAILLGCRDGPG